MGLRTFLKKLSTKNQKSEKKGSLWCFGRNPFKKNEKLVTKQDLPAPRVVQLPASSWSSQFAGEAIKPKTNAMPRHIRGELTSWYDGWYLPPAHKAIDEYPDIDPSQRPYMLQVISNRERGLPPPTTNFYGI